MVLPNLLAELLELLFALALPAATCTMVLAGVALRRESGVNFEVGGRFQRWMLWSVVLLTLPQFLSWFAAQGGIAVPPQNARAGGSWLSGIETSFNSFVSDIVIGRLAPLLAAFCVVKAALDAAQGSTPIGSVISAMFLLTIAGSVKLMQGWNSGSEFATADMLVALWNYLAGTILPEAAGLALVGAIVSYSRRKPFVPLLFSALAFLSITALSRLLEAMVQ